MRRKLHKYLKSIEKNKWLNNILNHFVNTNLSLDLDFHGLFFSFIATFISVVKIFGTNKM